MDAFNYISWTQKSTNSGYYSTPIINYNINTTTRSGYNNNPITYSFKIIKPIQRKIQTIEDEFFNDDHNLED